MMQFQLLTPGAAPAKLPLTDDTCTQEEMSGDAVTTEKPRVNPTAGKITVKRKKENFQINM